MPDPTIADALVSVDVDMPALLEAVAAADQTYGEAVGEKLQPLRDAIDGYVAAERLNLDDFTNGTHRADAAAAWDALAAAREDLEATCAKAEGARQEAYKAAIDAGTKPKA